MKIFYTEDEGRKERAGCFLNRLSLCRIDRRDKVKIIGWDQYKESNEC